MANILYIPLAFNSHTILNIPPGQDAETIAEEQGWNEAEWAEFDGSDYGITNSYDYKDAFSIVNNFPTGPNTVSLSLADAKDIGVILINKQSNVLASQTLGNLSADVYVAQAALPENERLQVYQDAIEANNEIAINTQVRIEQVFLATNLVGINEVVYPPAP
jgi:hypothetical protein